jgi:hypothetical protein
LESENSEKPVVWDTILIVAQEACWLTIPFSGEVGMIPMVSNILIPFFAALLFFQRPLEQEQPALSRASSNSVKIPEYHLFCHGEIAIQRWHLKCHRLR